MMKKHLLLLLLFIGFGILDASYLTYEHYVSFIPPCSSAIWFADCGKVLQSSYAVIAGIPLALIGVIYYCLLFTAVLGTMYSKRVAKYGLVVLSTLGFLSSLYFVYLQLVIIRSVCLYCMGSALLSLSIFAIIQTIYGKERQRLLLATIEVGYTQILKRILFMLNPERVHTGMTRFGEVLGSVPLIRQSTSTLFRTHDSRLNQTIAGIRFENPIGLAAGFDYEGRLTQILPSVGFGFQTIGTITNMAYEGNPAPMLGRLPKSKSLMVNKGFKNDGAKAMAQKLTGLSFGIPVGISIGRTNTVELKTQKASIADVLRAFEQFEKSRVHHSYYELNISCPNLYGDITFYPPKNLKELMFEVDKLHLSKPLFMKMPIEKSDSDVREMLEVLSNHSPVGVIFGNLQKDRHHPTLVPSEVSKFKKGYFSGKPTFSRSNELINLAYKHYNKRFTIIGCGGVFSGEDAYTKITLGASLVQLITGMIFQGPQLISQITIELADYLEKDGFAGISEAVGSRSA